VIDVLPVEKGVFIFQLASNNAIDILRTGKWRFNQKSMWQALRKVARFVHGQVLPGAVAEVGFLCTAAVYASPADAVPQLLGPLMDSILSALADAPVTGLSGDGPWAEFKVGKVAPKLPCAVLYACFSMMLGHEVLLSKLSRVLMFFLGAVLSCLKLEEIKMLCSLSPRLKIIDLFVVGGALLKKVAAAKSSSSKR